jgi:hypothetical protein
LKTDSLAMAAADVIDLCSSDEEQNDTQQISKIPLQQPHQAGELLLETARSGWCYNMFKISRHV